MQRRCKHAFATIEEAVSPVFQSASRLYNEDLTQVELELEQVLELWLQQRIKRVGSRKWLRRNGKKGIWLRKQDFVCELWLQLDCLNPLPGYD
jgi:hypothetical protein